MTHIDAGQLFEAIAAIDDELLASSHELPTHSRTPALRKRILLISAAVIAAAVFCGVVFAAAHFSGSRLSDEPMIASSADAYASNVEAAVTCEDISVELTDVVSENNLLYLEFVIDMPDIETVGSMGFVADSISVEIDGREALCHTGSSVRRPSDDGSFHEIDSFDLELLRHTHGWDYDYFGTHDFKISFDSVMIMYKSGRIKWVSGLWEYSFTYDVKDLSDQTIEYIIDREAVMSDGDRVILEKITATPISQRLVYYNCADNRTCHVIQAEGTDEFGNVLRFTNGEAIFGNDEDCLNICLATNENADDFSTEAQVIELRITADETYGETMTENHTPLTEVFRAVRAD